jgi:hypothetical protein
MRRYMPVKALALSFAEKKLGINRLLRRPELRAMPARFSSTDTVS